MYNAFQKYQKLTLHFVGLNLNQLLRLPSCVYAHRTQRF